jgi:hypothetical protein
MNALLNNAAVSLFGLCCWEKFGHQRDVRTMKFAIWGRDRAEYYLIMILKHDHAM